MLSVLLLLAAAQQSVIPVVPDQLSAPPSQPGAARLRVFGQTSSQCRSEVLQAADPSSPGTGLMWRENGEAVGLYLLLDRRINGCPAPVIVSYRVPGSNALGREMGRDFAPLPSPVPRP